MRKRFNLFHYLVSIIPYVLVIELVVLMAGAMFQNPNLISISGYALVCTAIIGTVLIFNAS